MTDSAKCHDGIWWRFCKLIGSPVYFAIKVCEIQNVINSREQKRSK